MKRRMFYFRNTKDDREPLGIVCQRNGIRYRAARVLFEAGTLSGSQHPNGGWFLSAAQTGELVAYANEHPELWLDPPPAA